MRGEEVVFDRFAIKLEQFDERPAPGGRVSFSLRPQSIHLHRQLPAAAGACVIAGRVAQRAYLGERWDYAVRVKDGETELRVTARPHEVFEVNQDVWGTRVQPSATPCRSASQDAVRAAL